MKFSALIVSAWLFQEQVSPVAGGKAKKGGMMQKPRSKYPTRSPVSPPPATLCPTIDLSSRPSSTPSSGTCTPQEINEFGTLLFTQDATPNAIFGSGNTNGFFTCVREDGLELCLRAKQRSPRMNPDGSWDNGDGTYTVPTGDSCCLPNPNSFINVPPFCLGVPVWNFEWTINTDYEGTLSRNADAFDYQISLDADPGDCSTNSLNLFPLEVQKLSPCADHYFGDNGTAQSGGTTAGSGASCDASVYANLLSTQNVVQQSWSYGFFPDGPIQFFDPVVEGTYDVQLCAGSIVDSTQGSSFDKELCVTIQVIHSDDQTLYDGVTTPGRPSGDITLTCP
mmetsp:Transcript_21328/g.44508  ORF Transcript_21328/g.44508 Transcript_21328/m.44508 type:complete len:337 (-) Transcript_21328:242-1252(-)|eukprot:CAMPEP_0172447970 /NCGR_PEP_ID=MMETSP1065-20121228/7092_1 /TAXON_ID=265537 /ORGANISM="Amphiprora paludosa, Strain CCMP125" /LENGTH=336 /DNA_ID=CAMNT_0013199343 /DNA_START=188 /DNA_END=1198 /DNA_ORIENTATION=+